jgi:UDP-glucose 4-epimerase
MARCLVLGANGFIGSHLIDKLVQNGETVRAFDRFGDRPINFLDDENIEKVSGDFLNRGDLSAALEDVDYVFHLVSTTTPATAENDPLIDIDTNIRMSVELLEECVSHKIKKVVFASTGGAIYGDINSGAPINEDTNPQPVSPYAIGKLTVEHYMRYFSRKFDLSTLTFRISNPYGQRHSPVKRQGVIPIYNLGSGQGVSLNQLIETIKNVTQREIRTEYLPKPPTFVQEVVLDINRFKNEFGLAPETSLQDGISKTWQYVLDSGHRD